MGGKIFMMLLIEAWGLCVTNADRILLVQTVENFVYTGAFVTAQGGVQVKDVINLIDVDGNPHPAPQRFRWNASGRCGVDFIFSFRHSVH